MCTVHCVLCIHNSYTNQTYNVRNGFITIFRSFTPISISHSLTDSVVRFFFFFFFFIVISPQISLGILYIYNWNACSAFLTFNFNWEKKRKETAFIYCVSRFFVSLGLRSILRTLYFNTIRVYVCEWKST